VTLADELALLLRPAGGGVHLVSTGVAEQRALQRALYGAGSEEGVLERWRADLARAADARAVLLGIPSDVGAGFRRGANLAPAALRARLAAEDPGFLGRARDAGLVDLGDVLVVPQLLHDEMLSPAQLEASRRALYPDVAAAERATLPVAPLSVAERALARVVAARPGAKVIALGGDHSTAWPVVKALAGGAGRLGVVQVDAHTDLLEERLGVRYCYGTWSFHANELLGRGGRLVQVGTRASRRDRTHWESSLGVRQVWAEEARRDPEAAVAAVLRALEDARVERVYFSNDIDGTDATFAEATGTPEPAGLDPELVVALLRAIAARFELAGGDVMEVAPALAPSAEASERTMAVAVRYLRETVAAALGISAG
jgi:arginase family enzyme